MSSNHEMAFDRLRQARPVPIQPVPTRSAAEFLDDLEDDAPDVWLVPSQARGTRRPMLVAAIIVLVGGVAIGLAASINRGKPTEPVTTVTEVVFDSSAAELPATGSMVGGPYQTDNLGTRLSMDLDEIWFLDRNEPGAIELSDGGAVSIVRPTALSDPTELTADPMFTWPTTDLDGWLSTAGSTTFRQPSPSSRRLTVGATG